MACLIIWHKIKESLCPFQKEGTAIFVANFRIPARATPRQLHFRLDASFPAGCVKAQPNFASFRILAKPTPRQRSLRFDASFPASCVKAQPSFAIRYVLTKPSPRQLRVRLNVSFPANCVKAQPCADWQRVLPAYSRFGSRWGCAGVLRPHRPSGCLRKSGQCALGFPAGGKIQKRGA